MKSVSGQYECIRKSGFGLDYFTSRVDRLTLQASGRFVLIVQDRSRIAHAAQSLANGQQVNAAAPEVRREGSFTVQGTTVQFRFDDGAVQQAEVSSTSDGGKATLKFGADEYIKTSDSTLLPSADRLKKDMEDIAKGIKIASTIGGVAFKAMKTIHDTIQSTQDANSSTTSSQTQSSQPQQSSQQTSAQPAYSQPVQPYANTQNTAARPAYQAQTVPPQTAQQNTMPSVYCDQCGTKARPGKKFCSSCGARLS